MYRQTQLKLNGKAFLEVKAHGCRAQSVLTSDRASQYPHWCFNVLWVGGTVFCARMLTDSTFVPLVESFSIITQFSFAL
jgi:hypothetical protein